MYRELNLFFFPAKTYIILLNIHNIDKVQLVEVLDITGTITVVNFFKINLGRIYSKLLHKSLLLPTASFGVTVKKRQVFKEICSPFQTKTLFAEGVCFSIQACST